MNDLSCGIRM